MITIITDVPAPNVGPCVCFVPRRDLPIGALAAAEESVERSSL